jgi:ParB family chromosome partitioning protein
MPSPDGQQATGIDALRARRAERTGQRAGHLPPPSRKKPDTPHSEVPPEPQPEPAGLGTPSDSRLLWIPISQLADKPGNRRGQDLAADPKTIELAGSMAAVGQLQPAGAVPTAAYLARHPGHAEVIGNAPFVQMFGHRRKYAAKHAGWETVECVVRDDPDGDWIDDAPLISNIHTEQLDPLYEAAYLQELHDRYGSQRAVASHIHKTQPYVHQRIKLLNLISDFQGLLADHEISIRVARDLAGLDHEPQQRVLAAGPPYSARNANRREQPATLAKPISFRYTGGDPAEMASKLRERLTPDDLNSLVENLTALVGHLKTHSGDNQVIADDDEAG